MDVMNILAVIIIEVLILSILCAILSDEYDEDDSTEETYRNFKNNNSNELEMDDKTLYFAKTNITATEPTKRDEDGCYDLYVANRFTDIEIQPHTNKLIDTGIATAFDPKWRLAIRERSSNTKSNMITMAGQVDSGYRDSIFVSIYNGNDIPLIITNSVDKVTKTDKKIYVPSKNAIAQFAMEEVPSLEIKEITYDKLQKFTSERGLGALGSSGK